MSETIQDLPKSHPDRQAVAKQLREIREMEKADLYQTERDGANYVSHLEGLQHSFDYIRTLPSRLVVDLGAGTTRGINQLAQSPMGHDLDFKATVLVNHPEIADNLGKERTIPTSVEVLNGIDDDSVGGFLGLYSIAYSDRLTLALSQIDRKLIPGGLIKATFKEINDGPSHVANLKDRTEFVTALQQKGYDLAITPTRGGIYDLVLGIKSGGSSDIKAEELLKEDEETFEEQEKILRELFPRGPDDY